MMHAVPHRRVRGVRSCNLFKAFSPFVDQLFAPRASYTDTTTAAATTTTTTTTTTHKQRRRDANKSTHNDYFQVLRSIIAREFAPTTQSTRSCTQRQLQICVHAAHKLIVSDGSILRVEDYRNEDVNYLQSWRRKLKCAIVDAIVGVISADHQQSFHQPTNQPISNQLSILQTAHT